MSAPRQRLARRAKLHDVDYAVLASGQQIPEYSSEDDTSSGDETYSGSTKKSKKRRKSDKNHTQDACMHPGDGAKSSGGDGKRRRKVNASDECFICQKESKSAFMQCEICARWYHYRCWKPFESSSVLGHTSCHECVQENAPSAFSTQPRKKIESIQDVVTLLKKSKKILVVAGAGMSVSCGIPDFRSKDGIYAMVRHMDTHLPEPECLFQIEYFRQDPSPFYQLVRNVFADSPSPSPTHYFLKLLQDKKKLLRLYSQNIDGLEEAAGVTKYIPCHGSFAWSTCMKCKHRVPTSVLMDVIQAGVIPTCSKEGCRGVLKPEITFFGELLSDHVSTSVTKDRLQADLLLVIGTSLKVSPVAEIPGFLPSHIPQVVINKTALKKKKLRKSANSNNGAKTKKGAASSGGETDNAASDEFDLTLLGNCDDIVQYICELTRWELPTSKATTKKPSPSIKVIEHADKPNVLCFGECHCASTLDDKHYHDDSNYSPNGFVW